MQSGGVWWVEEKSVPLIRDSHALDRRTAQHITQYPTLKNFTNQSDYINIIFKNRKK